MAKIECYNCKELTNAIAPRYRCGLCNYPLYKYIQLSDKKEPDEKVIDNIKEANHTFHGDNEKNDKNVSLLDSIRKSKISNSLLSRFRNNKSELEEEILDNEDLGQSPEIDENPSEAIFVENQNPDKSGKIVAGWLIVHTEDKQPLTFELFEGDNIIGRPDGPHHVDILVEKDKYVSRVHCMIRIEKDYLHRFNYRLKDNGKNRQGKPSTNGTYVNGGLRRLPKNEQVYLQDGDIVQVGETKLAFKNVNSSWSFESAAESVLQTDYTKTVAIQL